MRDKASLQSALPSSTENSLKSVSVHGPKSQPRQWCEASSHRQQLGGCQQLPLFCGCGGVHSLDGRACTR